MDTTHTCYCVIYLLQVNYVFFILTFKSFWLISSLHSDERILPSQGVRSCLLDL